MPFFFFTLYVLRKGTMIPICFRAGVPLPFIPFPDFIMITWQYYEIRDLPTVPPSSDCRFPFLLRSSFIREVAPEVTSLLALLLEAFTFFLN